MSDNAASVRMATLRLASDFKSIENDPPSGCSASPVSEDNLFQWNATIIGPDESPWEGAFFGLMCGAPRGPAGGADHLLRGRV